MHFLLPISIEGTLFQRMFDLAVEGGASINIKNKLNMTPLTVAAYLARQEMFFHIANIEREVYWQIGAMCPSRDTGIKKIIINHNVS